MGMHCEVCGKGRMIGHNVSYSKRRTRRVFLPNLRWVNLSLGGNPPAGGKKVKICMKCLKRAKIEGKIFQKVARKARVPRVPQELKETEELKKQKTETKKRGRPKKGN